MRSPAPSHLKRPILFAIVLLWIFAIACSSNDAAPHVGLADGCILNTDCTAPLVCAFRRCHNACKDTRDCPQGTRCVASDKPFHVCQLAVERDCSYNSQCPAGMSCGVDGQCRDECVADRDCLPGQRCVNKTCAEPAELNADGGLTAQPGADASGNACTYNSECPDPLICRNSVCAKECLEDRDCAAGLLCVASRCRTAASDGGLSTDGTASDGTTADSARIPDGAPDGYGQSCDHPSDCAPPLVCGPSGHCVFQCNTSQDCTGGPSFCCYQHACLTGSVCTTDAGSADAPFDAHGCTGDLECQDGIKCNGFERCVMGKCAPALKTACDDGDPCTIDTCDESTATCSHAPGGPVDQDRDGHYAIGAACGGDSGIADDCDDTNPDVYPGHAEVCDGVDNDCNGVADEGLWLFGDPVAIAGADAGVSYAPSGGTPQIVRATDGSFVILAAQGTGGPSLDAWHVTSTLGPLGGPVPLVSSSGPATCAAAPGRSASYPSLATNGAVVAAGGSLESGASCGCDSCSNCGGGVWTEDAPGAIARVDLGGVVATTLAEIATSCVRRPTVSVVSPSSVAWSPASSMFAYAWADNHLGDAATQHVYVAGLSASGALVAGPHALTTALASITVDATIPSRQVIAAGPSSVLVAFRSKAATAPSYVVLDPTLAGVIAGPKALTQVEDYYATSAIFGGSSFAVATTSVDGKQVRIHRIDPRTGAEMASSPLPFNGVSAGDVRVAYVNGGWAVTLSRGNRLAFAWTPENLATGWAVTESLPATSPATPSIVAIDAKHVAISWLDGTLRSTILTCGP